jgi:hypothetical protein
VKGTETLLKPRAANSRIAPYADRPRPPRGSRTFQSRASEAETPRPPRIRAPVPAWRLRLTRGKARARFLGGDRALAITSGSHQGQAIRIDSSAVDDCLRFSDQGLNQSRRLAVRFVGAACPLARHGMALNQWPFGSEEMSPAPWSPHRRDDRSEVGS